MLYYSSVFLLNICCLLATGNLEVRAKMDAISSSAAKVTERAVGNVSIIYITLARLHSPRNHGTSNQFHPQDIQVQIKYLE